MTTTGLRHPAAAGAHRRRDVQRGLPRRRVRARRLRGRRGRHRLGRRPAPRWPTNGSRWAAARPSARGWRACSPTPPRTPRPWSSITWAASWPRATPSPPCGWRSTLRSVSGAEPGPEASVRKLLGVEHEQRTQELGLGAVRPRRGDRFAEDVVDHQPDHHRAEEADPGGDRDDWPRKRDVSQDERRTHHDRGAYEPDQDLVAGLVDHHLDAPEDLVVQVDLTGPRLK